MKKTFTKKWVAILMTMAIVDIQLSYVLAFLNKVEIAQALSITIVTEIIGVMSGYFAKSFFETREEKKNEQDQLEKKTEQPKILG